MPRATPPKGQEKSCPTLDERLTCVTQICVDALRTHLSCPGKTLIAVMLIAANLRNQQALGTSAAAPALLLVHMRALQLHVLRELKSELAGEAQETNVCKGKKMARLKLRGGAEAFVATTDALRSRMRRRSRKTRWRRAFGKFGLVCSRRFDLARSGLQATDNLV